MKSTYRNRGHLQTERELGSLKGVDSSKPGTGRGVGDGDVSERTSHANAATTELLGLSAQQQNSARYARAVWVSFHPRVQETLQILEQILDQPRTTRMPSIAMFGDSGMGKTTPNAEVPGTDHPPGVDAGRTESIVERPPWRFAMTSRPEKRRFCCSNP